MSESDAYVLAAIGVIALWVLVIAWCLAEAGLDPSRIPLVGPVFEHTWDAIVGAVRSLLGAKR